MYGVIPKSFLLLTTMDNGQQVLSPAFMMEARLFYQNGLGSFLTDLQCGVKYMCTLEMPNTILQMTFYKTVSMFSM